MRRVLFFLLLSNVLCASNYYPNAIFELNDESLKDLLFRLTKKDHQPQTYKGARRIIFTKIFLQKDELGYFVNDFYCNVKQRQTVSPQDIPHHEILNTEHLWPQMFFSYPHSNIQKSDLHHLFPVGHRSNSHRGNLSFGEVANKEPLFEGCSDSSRGVSGHFGGQQKFFEPPSSIKGDIARAIFYFSVRYQEEIDEAQEFFLRKWHWEDPVDQIERERHAQIYYIQKNRNPFIDYPELVAQIINF